MRIDEAERILRWRRRKQVISSSFTSYGWKVVKFFNLAITLFLSILTIHLTIKYGENTEQIQRLTQLISKQQQQIDRLDQLIVGQGFQNTETMRLVRSLDSTLHEIRIQSNSISDLLNSNLVLEVLQVREANAKMQLDITSFLTSFGKIEYEQAIASTDSSKWTVANKFEFISIIDSLVSKEINNTVLVSESFYVKWQDIGVGTKSIILKVKKQNEIIKAGDSQQIKYANLVIENLVSPGFVEIMSRINSLEHSRPNELTITSYYQTLLSGLKLKKKLTR